MTRAAPDRSRQRLRTRKDLLEAGARLIKSGRTPTLEKVAEEALVSRATAYRYFPSIESLLLEAPLDGLVPSPESLFTDNASLDPAERVDRAEAALHEMCYRNEAQLRALLAASLQRPRGATEQDSPVRQNRRTPLIEAALAPARDRLPPADYQRLCAALAMLFGIESMVVSRDVLELDEAEARRVKSWAVRALVHAALAQSPSG